MVNLGNGGVLGLQFLLAAAQFADVTAQHDTTHATIGVHQRQRAHGHRGFVGVQFGIHRGFAAQYQWQRFQHRIVLMQQFGADLAQILPLHGADRSQTTETADGVRRRVSDDAVDGEHDEAIRHTCVMALVHNRVTVRELAARNHLIQLFAGADAFGLITAVRFACGHVGLADHQAKRLAIMTHRGVHVADLGLADRTQFRGAEHRFGVHGRVKLGAQGFRDDVADHILGSQTHHRGRTALLGNDVLALAVLQD